MHVCMYILHKYKLLPIYMYVCIYVYVNIYNYTFIKIYIVCQKFVTISCMLFLWAVNKCVRVRF